MTPTPEQLLQDLREELIDYIEERELPDDKDHPLWPQVERINACLDALSPPSVPGEEPKQLEQWTAESIVEELDRLSECDHDFCHWCNYDADAELHTDACLLAIVERSLAAQPKAPSPTPGEVEASLRWLQSNAAAYCPGHGYATTTEFRGHLATLRQAIASRESGGWSRKVPTERGWYWWWGNKTCPPVCLLVTSNNTGELILVDPIHEESSPLSEISHSTAWWQPAVVPPPPADTNESPDAEGRG